MDGRAEEMMHAFKVFDKNGDNFISRYLTLLLSLALSLSLSHTHTHTHTHIQSKLDIRMSFVSSKSILLSTVNLIASGFV